MWKIMFSLVIGIFLIIGSYLYFDKPIVYFLHDHHSRDLILLNFFANQITTVITAGIAICYVYLCLRILSFRLTQFETKLLIICNAVVITWFMKEQLKYVFGRYWAETFIGNKSLLADNIYGFNWFSSASTSFPSGHVAFISAFAGCCWAFFPRWRFLWMALVTIVCVGQVGMYYHFLSDAIAGALLGGLVAFVSIRYINPKKGLTRA